MNAGTGPGAFTPDGSPVEFYAAVTAAGEPGIVQAAVPAGGSILELGSGAGRVTHALLDLGYEVVAVDESADMLARIRGARTVLARIEDLALDRRFDAVLLASLLIHVPGEDSRRHFLDCCRRHVRDDGVVVIQWIPLDVRATWSVGTTFDRSGFTTTITEFTPAAGGLMSVTMAYETHGRRWTQSFTERPLTDDQLTTALADAGLAIDRFLTPDRTWFAARATR
ncbi:Methyltransferase domain-containing protein [Nonomuraea solani]|uniref:Methyltransferase domain-containing protein n=1 Tax=Nonomuraea solani TaxID=1144553 RepID=A0A1H6F157_9ACTN|nr:class I SAM-dependent methyltransferase [Nonomuraea solani]SEH02919.1 Methyltransferase domain-containing protein [Nonomuraea solani]